MYCNNCGEQIQDGAKFCTNCGARLVNDDSYQEEVEWADNPERDYRYDYTPQPTKKKHWFLRIFFLFIVIALGAYAYISFSPKPSQTNQKQSVFSEVINPKPPTFSDAKDKSISVSISLLDQTIEVDGLYTGPLKDGKAHGKGTFSVDNEDGGISYKGLFSNGQINGAGTLCLSMGEDGELIMEGTFKQGGLDGYGVTTFNFEGETILWKGTYTNGVFTPTAGEKFDYLGQVDLLGLFALPQEMIAYIDSHPKLFPVADPTVIKSMKYQSFEYRQFTKTRKQNDMGLIKLELYAMQVSEDFSEDINQTVTSLSAADKDENVYAIFYLGSSEVLDGDRITVYALPVATSSYDNIGGGTTNVIVLAACYIEVK